MGTRVRPTGIISLIQSLKPVCSSLELTPMFCVLFMPQERVVFVYQAEQDSIEL
jgi:hypothetical protein